MPNKLSLVSTIAVAIVAAVGFTPSVQAAACAKGICVSSQADGAFLKVRYWVQSGPVTHVNIRQDNRQWEGGPRGTFEVQRRAVTRYSLQKCVRGTGVFGKSTCSQWASFRTNSSR